jgi:hypothetical protein
MNLSLSTPREIPAPGVYPAQILRILDLGTQTMANSKFPPSRKLRVVFELSGESGQMTDGRQFVVDKTYSATLSQKSNLFKDLSAFAYDLIVAAEVGGEPVNIGKLLGRGAMLQIGRGQSDSGSEFARIVAIMALPKGVTIEKSANASYFLSLEAGEFDAAVFAAQPDFIKTAIEGSPEYKKLLSK